jgi:hypothetical protein
VAGADQMTAQTLSHRLQCVPPRNGLDPGAETPIGAAGESGSRWRPNGSLGCQSLEAPGFAYVGRGSAMTGGTLAGGISTGDDGELKSLAKVASGSSRRSSEEVVHLAGRAGPQLC